MPTFLYRNDSKEVFDVPGWGYIGPGQRVSHGGDHATPIVIENYPGLVDVLAEEASGIKKDYETEPEPDFDEAAHHQSVLDFHEARNAEAAAEQEAARAIQPPTVESEVPSE